MVMYWLVRQTYREDIRDLERVQLVIIDEQTGYENLTSHLPSREMKPVHSFNLASKSQRNQLP